MRKYKTDSKNRLIITDDSVSYAVNGSFALGPQNNLAYFLNEPPAWRKERNLPNKITFTGNWDLDANHCLELKLKEDNPPFIESSTLTIHGDIISLEADKLTFELKTVDRRGQAHFALFKFAGELNCDGANQVFFSVSKKQGSDTLLLGAGWRLNKNQQITFKFRKNLSGNARPLLLNYVTISGFWQVAGVNKLCYILSAGPDKSFDFRAFLQTANLYPKKNSIKYRLGAGITQDQRAKAKLVTFYGEWKFSRGLSLSFEMAYDKGRMHGLEFGAEVAIDKANRVVLALKDAQGKDFGLKLTFTHRFWKHLDAQVFLKIKKTLKEQGIDVGVIFPL